MTDPAVGPNGCQVLGCAIVIALILFGAVLFVAWIAGYLPRFGGAR